RLSISLSFQSSSCLCALAASLCVSAMAHRDAYAQENWPAARLLASNNPYEQRRAALRVKTYEHMQAQLPEVIQAETLLSKNALLDQPEQPRQPLKVVIPNLKLTYQQRHNPSTVLARSSQSYDPGFGNPEQVAPQAVAAVS